METIFDPAHIIELIASMILGFFFANKIEKIIGIIVIMIIAGTGLSMVYDEEANPNKYNIMNSTGVSNLTRNITDFTTLGVNAILSLVVGGIGTGVGIGIRRIFWP